MLFNNISNFFDFTYEKTTNVNEFVNGFCSRLGRISRLELNEKLKSTLLLRQTNLDVHNRSNVIGSAGGNYSLRAIATSLQNAYRSEVVDATSMTTLSPSHSHCTHFKSIESVRNTHRIDSANASRALLFYTFVSANYDSQNPSAIIDTGACGSVVGQETLDKATYLLNIEELDDKRIDLAEHQFSPNEKPHKTICAVCNPFLCRNQKTRNTFRFQVRFDVITGSLTFFIGLASMVALKATLNFQYRNLSLVKHNTMYRIRLTHQSMHLRLLSECEI